MILRSAVIASFARADNIRSSAAKSGAVALSAVGDLADVAFEAKLAARQQTQRLGIDAMLDAEDALRQRLGRVVIGHRDAPCIGPASVSGITKCTVALGRSDPGLQRLAVRIEA